MDVNQIFKELGQMIHDQGTVVDSIESSVEHASQNVETGAQQLHQAVNYKVRKTNPELFTFCQNSLLSSDNRKMPTSWKTRLNIHH